MLSSSSYEDKLTGLASPGHIPKEIIVDDDEGANRARLGWAAEFQAPTYGHVTVSSARLAVALAMLVTVWCVALLHEDRAKVCK